MRYYLKCVIGRKQKGEGWRKVKLESTQRGGEQAGRSAKHTSGKGKKHDCKVVFKCEQGSQST